ncbi:MAG TPA: cyanophycin synthetase [Victivallales bacterium]|nr:cyanophycin synthetase [Victivallales bacterium]
MRFDLLKLNALRGPNLYSRGRAIFMLVNSSEFNKNSTDITENFSLKLLNLLPTLKNNKKFISRLGKGTSLTDVLLNVAIELQNLAGLSVSYGETFSTKDENEHAIVFQYIVENAGREAAKESLWLVESIVNNKEYDVEWTVLDLKEYREKDKYSVTTQFLVDEAAKRNIPHIRLNHKNFVQLGYGKYQKKIQSSITSKTSALSLELADEKFRTKEILQKYCIPVPEGIAVRSFEDAVEYISEISFPVVVKPEVGNHGRGISININDYEELKIAFDSAEKIYSYILVEKYIHGRDYRILVIDGEFIAASYREPPYITGDGESTVQELIDRVNGDPLRGIGHENILTKIVIDEMTFRILKHENVTLSDVLNQGKKLYLKTTANLSQGGTATDVTEIVHPEIRLMAERTARIIGMDVIGIDFICQDISKSVESQNCGIIEVNAEPGLRMHVYPSKGKSIDVAKPILDMLFPENSEASIPIIAVTGTNGKTTTCKLIAHALKYAGRKVGYATTTGVEIDGIEIVKGDYSGPDGHKLVLKDATIDHAVLETARGGILRRGLAYNECDIGVFLNVGEDHIGNDLIESIEDLGVLKSTVVRAVKSSGFSILNADDTIVMKLKNNAEGNHILFSMDPNNKYIINHVRDGGIAVVFLNDNIVIRTKDQDDIISPVINVPITFGGLAEFNISNTLAAVGVLHGLGFKNEVINNGITSFYPSIQQNPGRMNIFDFNSFKVILDYGHNKHAMEALHAMLPKFSQGRKIVICHGSGNRPDEVLKNFAGIIAKAYDHIIITDLDIRQRELGETAEVVKQGILENGFNSEEVEIVLDVHEAIDRAFEIVRDGDLIVVQVDKIQPVIDQILSKKENVLSCLGI